MTDTGLLPPFTVTKGDSFQTMLEFFTDKANTVPLDLTIYTDIHMQVRPTMNSSGDIIAEASLTNGMTITGESHNILNIDLEELDSPAGVYYFDIRFSQQNGEVIDTLLKGKIIITDNITELP